MNVQQKRIVKRPLMEVIKVNPDPGSGAAGRAAPHLVRLGQEWVVKHPFIALEQHPVAADWHSTLEFIDGEINAFPFQRAKGCLESPFADPRAEIVESDFLRLQQVPIGAGGILKNPLINKIQKILFTSRNPFLKGRSRKGDRLLGLHADLMELSKPVDESNVLSHSHSGHWELRTSGQGLISPFQRVRKKIDCPGPVASKLIQSDLNWNQKARERTDEKQSAKMSIQDAPGGDKDRSRRLRQEPPEIGRAHV